MARSARPGGGVNAGVAFMIGALLVVLAVIAVFVLGRGMFWPEPKPVEVDVRLPRMEAPRLPPVEPPTVPTPSPAPSTSAGN